ncbi:MAG: tRNA pseudouridine(38-40) synthase TruA, partial [Desulfurobacteriaceae bacterium]
MRNLKLTVEYLGTNYYGWQVLPDKPTVQGKLIETLKIILREDVKLIGASRTDAGVHAFGQVANFKTLSDIETERLKRALNGLLPPDIRVVEVEEVPLSFDARRSAEGKRYRYRIFNREVASPFEYKRAWFFPFPLDVERMREAARFFVGVHDFTTFSKRDKSQSVNPVREVNAVYVEKDGNVIEVTVYGRSFLRHMVRIMVATLVKVGEGKLDPDSVKLMMEAKDRKVAPFL